MAQCRTQSPCATYYDRSFSTQVVWESFSCEAGGVLVDANWARLHRVILLEESLPDREHTHTHPQAPRRRGTVALKALRKVPERRTQDWRQNTRESSHIIGILKDSN